MACMSMIRPLLGIATRIPLKMMWIMLTYRTIPPKIQNASRMTASKRAAMKGAELEEVCLWDFVAQTVKVAKSGGDRDAGSDTDELDDEECEEYEHGDESTMFDFSDGVGDTIPDDYFGEHVDIMNSLSNKRQLVSFCDEHDESARKCIQVLRKTQRRIPVPIGPRLPRDD
ncbi:hypothetical protein OH77DRAFT_1582281, partial [Trametes cingulata]